MWWREYKQYRWMLIRLLNWNWLAMLKFSITMLSDLWRWHYRFSRNLWRWKYIRSWWVLELLPNRVRMDLHFKSKCLCLILWRRLKKSFRIMWWPKLKSKWWLLYRLRIWARIFMRKFTFWMFWSMWRLNNYWPRVWWWKLERKWRVLKSMWSWRGLDVLWRTFKLLSILWRWDYYLKRRRVWWLE